MEGARVKIDQARGLQRVAEAPSPAAYRALPATITHSPLEVIAVIASLRLVRQEGA